MIISGWDKWQCFRKDRGTPPWIKIYRNLMSNEQWVSLTDSEKGQLVSIWILGADKNGSIPDSPVMIQRMAMLDSKPNISKFIDLGFLTTTCQPLASQENNESPQLDLPEERRVEQSRVEDNKPSSDSKAKSDQILEIFEFWKSEMDHPRAKMDDKRKKLIQKALKTGYTIEDCKNAISGCQLTPWNMGINPDGQMFDSIELILRNSEKIDRFIGNFNSPPAPKNDAERRYLANAQAAREAMEQIGGGHA